MSGDLGAEIVVRAAHSCLETHPNLELILVGDEAELGGLVTRIVGNEKRLSIKKFDRSGRHVRGTGGRAA